MTAYIKRVQRGFKVPINGLNLIKRDPKLIKFIAIPLFINFFLFIGGLFYITSEVGELINSFMTGLKEYSETLYSVSYYFVVVLAWIALTGILVLVVYLIASILAAPFYSLLAERTWVNINPRIDKKFNFAQFLKTALRMMMISLGKAAVLLIVSVAVFVISFIPGLNFIAIYVAYIIIAFDCSDYVLEVKELGLGERFSYLRKYLPEYSGAALILGAFSFIPGLIFLAIPFTIAGMAQMIYELEESES